MQQYVIQFYRLRLVEGEIEEKAKSNHDAPDSFEGLYVFHILTLYSHTETSEYLVLLAKVLNEIFLINNICE